MQIRGYLHRYRLSSSGKKNRMLQGTCMPSYSPVLKNAGYGLLLTLIFLLHFLLFFLILQFVLHKLSSSHRLHNFLLLFFNFLYPYLPSFLLSHLLLLIIVIFTSSHLLFSGSSFLRFSNIFSFSRLSSNSSHFLIPLSLSFSFHISNLHFLILLHYFLSVSPSSSFHVLPILLFSILHLCLLLFFFLLFSFFLNFYIFIPPPPVFYFSDP